MRFVLRVAVKDANSDVERRGPILPKVAGDEIWGVTLSDGRGIGLHR